MFCRTYSTIIKLSNTLDTVDIDLLKIAETWSFWNGELPEAIPRRVDLPDELRDSIALVIEGVRRCGKSTLMSQLIDRYSLDPAHCAFVNFEDPRLARVQTFETLERLVSAFRERHAQTEKLYFFLDEIQGVDGWQKWLRMQLDRPSGDYFVLTGSNATLLSGELATTLTGRHLSIELFPFDLEERRVESSASIEEYLETGGFPEPLSMSDGDRLLRQYFEDIIERDIRERVGARSSAPLRQLAQMVFESAGSELSLRRIAGSVGVAVDTASSHLEACKSAYLLFECPYFAYSERKRAHRNSKYYPIDTGLRRVVITPGGRDLGKSLECATYLHLRRNYDEVYYWRGAGEVDFVVQHEGKVVPIQVTWEEPKPRHERGLEAFYERHRHAEEAIYVTSQNFESAFDF